VKNLGIILLVMSIAVMAFSELTDPANKPVSKVKEVSPVAVKREILLSWSSIAGVGLFVAGILIVVLGKKS